MSQRVQPSTTNYSNVCSAEVYAAEQKCAGVDGNWNRDREAEKQDSDTKSKVPNEKVGGKRII